MPANSLNTQDLVSIKEVRDDTVVLKDGSLRKVIMVGGLNFALKSEEEQNAITQAYRDFLNSVDFSLQIIVHSRRMNIERYLQSLEARKAQEISGLLQNQISEYQEFIRGFIKEYAVMRKTFLIVVPFTPIGLPSRDTISSIFSLGGGKKKTAPAPVAGAAGAGAAGASAPAVPAVPDQQNAAKEEEFDQHVAQLDQRVQQVVEGLRTIGLETTILNDDQLVELFYNFYNPETIEKEEFNLPGS